MMYRVKILLLLILVFSLAEIHQCFSQVSQEWVARYHFYSEDQAKDIAVDDSGNVYVTGSSQASTPNGAKFDYATIKYNSAGAQQWSARYNGPGNDLDEPTSIAIDNSGNVYVTGFSRSGSTGAYNDFATIKYNSAGVQQWVRRYNGGGSDIAVKVLIDNNGDIFVGGWTTRSATGADFTVIKYNQNGDSLWVRIYDSGGSDNRFDYAVAMELNSTGNVYLAGSVGLNLSSAPDWATVKWDAQGNFIWVQRFDGPGNDIDYPQSIAVDDSGNVYVTGYVWGNNTTNYATIKYDSAGDQKWVSYYPNASALAIAVDDSSNSYVTGANGNFLTIKYNPSGSEQWVMSFNGPGNSADIPCCIKLDDSANVYITGYATINSSNSDYCTIKYNTNGEQQWVMYYNGIGNSYDQPTALAVDKAGNVYVTGSSRGPGNNDYATVKYSQTVGIQQLSNEVPSEFKLYQNYPNPFNPRTRIKFEISELSGVNLIVYDIMGREIKTLVNNTLSRGVYEVNFDGNNISSGVYYYRLKIGEFSDTKKMILVK